MSTEPLCIPFLRKKAYIMKKTFRRLLVLMLTLVMVLQLLPGAQAAAKTSGSCGMNVKWSYNKKTKTLTISGKGAMKEYESWEAPWYQEDLRINMKKLVVKKGVTSISDDAFAETSLTSVSLPSTLTKIGSNAFCESDLTSVTIPKNVKTIGDGAFYAAPLKAYKVAKGNKYFCAKDGVLYNKRMTVLIDYPDQKKDKSYTVPNGVKTIGSGVLLNDEGCVGGNYYLSKLILPKTVTKIGSGAFQWNCLNLYFKGKAPVFAENALLCSHSTIYYPSKYRSSWKKAAKALKAAYADSEDTNLTWKSWKG